MAIQDPQKPWAVVLCSIEGSSPPPSTADLFRGFFSPSPTHSTVVDFWKDSTLGLVDIGGSEVFGWYDSGYTMIGTPQLSSYIGVTEGGPSPLRGDLISHARALLQSNNPGLDLSRFRSILAVYNFDVNGGQSGEDVVYGLQPGALSWARRNWSRCKTCSGLFRWDAAASICAGSVGSTPFAHTRDGDELQVPNVPTLLSSLGGFSTCLRCGVLYELASANGCPAGGAHANDGSLFYLPMNWASTFKSSGWQRCQNCGLVLQPGPQYLCPVTAAAHVTRRENFSFPLIAASPSLTWMCHEMGHAYGFIHGRSSAPASTDLDDDASPGAYGDRYDVMSAMNCALFINPQGYEAGPALATHQLLPMTAVPIQDFDPSKGFDSIVIRTPDSPVGSGPILARMGNFVAELRIKNDPRGLPGWDQNLDFGSGGAGVLVHNLQPFAPTLLPSTKGDPYLLEGQRFLTREGLGTIAIEVSHIDEASRTARLTVWNQNTLATGALQRWLVIPCTYNGDPAKGYTAGDLDGLLQDVEGYWSDVSGGASNIGGHYVLQPARAGILRYVVPANADDVRDQTPEQRVQALIEVVRNDFSPLNSDKEPFLPLPRFLDWRWFTGIIVISDLPATGGYLGRMRLPSGNLPRSAVTPNGGFNAVEQQPIGDGFGPLNFEVIEAGLDRATAAALNMAVGASLALQTTTGDPYHLMNTDSGTLRAATDDEWRLDGPFISTDQMDSLGWLAGRDLVVQIPYEQSSTSGRATLVALTKRSEQQGWLRLNFGPVRCECRYSEGVDAALPAGTVVLVWDSSGVPHALRQGESISWVGATLIEGAASALPMKVFGGGSLTVLATDGSGATISYQASAGMRLIDVPVPWEVLMKIPPGDPWEKQFQSFVNEHVRPAAQRFLAESAREVARQQGLAAQQKDRDLLPGQAAPR